MIRWPGHIAEDSTERLTGTVDIAPTVLEAAGVAPDPVQPPLDALPAAARGARSRPAGVLAARQRPVPDVGVDANEGISVHRVLRGGRPDENLPRVLRPAPRPVAAHKPSSRPRPVEQPEPRSPPGPARRRPGLRRDPGRRRLPVIRRFAARPARRRDGSPAEVAPEKLREGDHSVRRSGLRGGPGTPGRSARRSRRFGPRSQGPSRAVRPGTRRPARTPRPAGRGSPRSEPPELLARERLNQRSSWSA